MTEPLALQLQDLASGYQGRPVIEDVTLGLPAGQWTTIIGPNGAGKSTLLRAIMGIAEVYAGSVAVGGVCTTGLPTHRMCEHGVAFVPQGGQVFGELLVEEDAAVGGIRLAGAQLADRLETVFAGRQLLQPLRKRVAFSLSGGEKQALALTRNRVPDPRLLLVDEPTAALSPALAEEVLEALKNLCTEGVAILAVEQRVDAALAHSDEIVVLRLGRVVDRGPGKRFEDDTSWHQYFL